MSIVVIADSYYGLAIAHLLAGVFPDVHCLLNRDTDIPTFTSRISAIVYTYDTLLNILKRESPYAIICFTPDGAGLVCEYHNIKKQTIVSRSFPQVVPRILYVGARYPHVRGFILRETALTGSITLMQSNKHSTIECGCFPTSIRDNNIFSPSPLLFEGNFDVYLELTSLKTLHMVICGWIGNDRGQVNVVLKHRYRWTPELLREVAGYNNGVFTSRPINLSLLPTVESNAHTLFGPINDYTLEEITGFYAI